MDYPSLGDWLRHQRSLRDLTQEALAEEVGCAVQTIRAFENGWRRPSRAMAERIALVLAVPPDERAAFLRAARAPSVRGGAVSEHVAQPVAPAAYLARIAGDVSRELYGPNQQHWLEQLDSELEVLREALLWALDTEAPDRAARVELALRAASALERFWHGRGHQAEGQDWIERALDLIDRQGLEVSSAAQASALGTAGWLARIRGDRPRALSLLHRCVALCRTIGDTQGTSDALDTLGDIALSDGDAIAAAWFFEESLALRRDLHRLDLVALSLNGLGHAAVARGYYERATEHFLESLAILRDVDDRRSTALALQGLGLARLRQGNLAAATPMLSDALERFNTLENTLDVALCLELIGELLALRVLTGSTDDVRLLEDAARLWGASEQILASFGIRLNPPDLARRDALIAAARLRVGPECFQARWREGGALDQGRAVAVGLAVIQGADPDLGLLP